MQRLPFTPKDLVPFLKPLVDNPREGEKLARLTYAILSTPRSARKSDWARHYRKDQLQGHRAPDGDVSFAERSEGRGLSPRSSCGDW